ncbi:unnamed protein product [Lupinus luteus]|uniref:DUF4283 domain-containing protein n=1 Tax=Lupinus luteus TaxID=3873 RepID=A0AAV1VX66_LUPLU
MLALEVILFGPGTFTGMIWVWPGTEPPAVTLPSLQPPSGFKVQDEAHYANIYCFLHLKRTYVVGHQEIWGNIGVLHMKELLKLKYLSTYMSQELNSFKMREYENINEMCGRIQSTLNGIKILVKVNISLERNNKILEALQPKWRTIITSVALQRSKDMDGSYEEKKMRKRMEETENNRGILEAMFMLLLVWVPRDKLPSVGVPTPLVRVPLVLPLHVSGVTSELEWLSLYMVGRVHKEVTPGDVVALLQAEGIFTISVHLLGEDLLLLSLLAGENVDDVFKDAGVFLSSIFSSVSPWSMDCVSDCRDVWVRFFGIPVQAWNVDLFHKIAREFGTLLVIDDDALNKSGKHLVGQVSSKSLEVSSDTLEDTTGEFFSSADPLIILKDSAENELVSLDWTPKAHAEKISGKSSFNSQAVEVKQSTRSSSVNHLLKDDFLLCEGKVDTGCHKKGKAIKRVKKKEKKQAIVEWKNFFIDLGDVPLLRKLTESLCQLVIEESSRIFWQFDIEIDTMHCIFKSKFNTSR